jgi:uncharacterized protein VirK/YbjX
MTGKTFHQIPGLWQGPLWALRSNGGGSISRLRLAWRTLVATLAHSKAMHRWMAVAFEMQSRGIISDLPSQYLRAARPFVHRSTGVSERVVQLIDHVDWLETAFTHSAFERITSGEPLVLAELAAPRGYDYMRLLLQRAAEVQHKPRPVDAAAMSFSRFRVDGVACLVIGGVRGQRHPVLRLSPVEISQALSGWKPGVLMVCVAQELARYWGLRVIGLDPSAHMLQGWTYQLSKRYRESAQRIYNSYDALWEHFDAKYGPPGWMILPQDSDEKLAATALSPEKRARQTRRADYWIRTRNLLRQHLRELLKRPDRGARMSRHTEGETIASDEMGTDLDDFMDSGDMGHSRVLETGPGSLL